MVQYVRKLNNHIPDKFRNLFIFTGKRDDVERIISMFDVGILLSNTNGHAEGISNALTEIMVQSIPVIATNAGGNPELIENNVSGFLINPFSTVELQEKMNVLLNNDKLRAEMGNAAKKDVSKKFGMKRMVKEHLDAYKELLASKN